MIKPSEAVLVLDKMPKLCPMVRTPGIHVSACISRIAERKKHYVAGGHPPPGDLELGNTFERGFKERLYETYPDRFDDPGEVEIEVILPKSGKVVMLYGTPDLIEWGHPQFGDVIPDIKTTKYSSAKTGPKSTALWRMWAQVMAYCYMLEIETGALFMLFLRGDYSFKDERDVEYYKAWYRRFNKPELLWNWKRILIEAEGMEDEAVEAGFEGVEDRMIKQVGGRQ